MITSEEFQNLSLRELYEQTGISKSIWSLYFNGHRYMTERTLRRVAGQLDMPSEDLLRAINAKRDKVKSKRNKALKTT